ncbi:MULTISPECIES: TIGR03086 family metal-binding protein [unclassified Pseudonocardia]|uniref:TIGR03086 family metal-binding protein n=1 Tax=unclassified Pseudonocardia TaxID=2619320 RepID=UPI000761F219|nr:MULTISPECIES: TIGR03086 family metal-binding protein [unclassified Pseudonocardia]
MDRLSLLDAAVGLFDDRVSAVTGAQWTRPTPCKGWTVLDLVEHVVAGHRMAVELLEKGPPASPSESTSASLREDRRSAQRQRRAFAGAHPATDVDHPAGRITVSEFLVYRAADITVHAWDLARAIDVDDQLPEELVEHVLEPYAAWVSTLTVEQMFGSGPSRIPPRAKQDRLLDQLGRRP